jgi:rhodanese-related sulfurtransferase
LNQREAQGCIKLALGGRRFTAAQYFFREQAAVERCPSANHRLNRFCLPHDLDPVTKTASYPVRNSIDCNFRDRSILDMEGQTNKAVRSLPWRMLGILFTAIALGLVFNSFNPMAPSLSENDSDSAVPNSVSLGIGTIPTVKWPGVKALLANGGLVLIDARSFESYETNHIPSAISIPAEISDSGLNLKTSKYSRSQPIVVYCASESCHLSAALALRLRQLGFTNVQDMKGGLAEYLLAEQESTK